MDLGAVNQTVMLLRGRDGISHVQDQEFVLTSATYFGKNPVTQAIAHSRVLDYPTILCIHLPVLGPQKVKVPPPLAPTKPCTLQTSKKTDEENVNRTKFISSCCDDPWNYGLLGLCKKRRDKES